MLIKKFKEPHKVRRCLDCREPGVIIIDGNTYCSNCGDGVLIRTIKQCIIAIELAEIKISIKPKGVLCRQRKLTKSQKPVSSI